MKYILLLLLPFNVFALELGLEHGSTTSFAATPKYYVPAKYSAVTFRSSGLYFIEGLFGNWYGETYGEFYGASFGAKSKGVYFAEGTLGIVRLHNYKTNNLDGNKQFTYTVGIGRKFDNLSVCVKFRHFSNGNTQGKNWGMDFKLFSLEYLF